MKIKVSLTNFIIQIILGKLKKTKRDTQKIYNGVLLFDHYFK